MTAFRYLAVSVSTLAVCLMIPRVVEGLGSGAKIPDPTNFYKEQGMGYFLGDNLRFSQTVYIMNTREQTYLGPRWNEETEEYELFCDFKERGRDNLFEIIDAGTYSNVPKNTEPRAADLLDGNKQKFYVRFNESLVLRNERINKYVATTGHNFGSSSYLTDNVNLAESWRVLPVFSYYRPDLFPIATNDNLRDEKTYVLNGTLVHLLNTQLNFMQKIPNFPKMIIHGPGKQKKRMWKDSDIFQILMLKKFEE